MVGPTNFLLLIIMQLNWNVYNQHLGLKHEMLIDETKEINKEGLFLTAI